MGFPKIRGTILGVPIKSFRIYIGVPLLGKLPYNLPPSLGNSDLGQVLVVFLGTRRACKCLHAFRV